MVVSEEPLLPVEERERERGVESREAIARFVCHCEGRRVFGARGKRKVKSLAA